MADKKETEPSFGEASNGNPRWAKLGAVNNERMAVNDTKDDRLSSW
jgi:hypothetical protein